MFCSDTASGCHVNVSAPEQELRKDIGPVIIINSIQPIIDLHHIKLNYKTAQVHRKHFLLLNLAFLNRKHRISITLLEPFTITGPATVFHPSLSQPSIATALIQPINRPNRMVYRMSQLHLNSFAYQLTSDVQYQCIIYQHAVTNCHLSEPCPGASH